VTRHEALEALSRLVTTNDLFVSSIGGLWDDWWNLRPGGEDNTFCPTVIGSVSSTALGLALALTVIVLVVLLTGFYVQRSNSRFDELARGLNRRFGQ